MGEAFLETDTKILYVRFNQDGIDKSYPGKIVDKGSLHEYSGKLCLGKRDLKGFLYIDSTH